MQTFFDLTDDATSYFQLWLRDRLKNPDQAFYYSDEFINNVDFSRGFDSPITFVLLPEESKDGREHCYNFDESDFEASPDFGPRPVFMTETWGSSNRHYVLLEKVNSNKLLDWGMVEWDFIRLMLSRGNENAILCIDDEPMQVPEFMNAPLNLTGEFSVYAFSIFEPTRQRKLISFSGFGGWTFSQIMNIASESLIEKSPEWSRGNVTVDADIWFQRILGVPPTGYSPAIVRAILEHIPGKSDRLEIFSGREDEIIKYQGYNDLLGKTYAKLKMWSIDPAMERWGNMGTEWCADLIKIDHKEARQKAYADEALF